MLVREVSAAISTAVQAAPRVDVPVLPHVIRRRVMLATHDADVPLLAVAEGPQAVTLGTFSGCGGWGDLFLVDHVVGVVVGDVMILRLKMYHFNFNDILLLLL